MANNVRVRVDWRGRQVKQEVRRQGGIGVRMAAELLLEESKTICPFDEGILENSGSVDFDAVKTEATVFYDTPYAARLHEHPEYNFKGKGQGKWLEKSLNKKQASMLRLIKQIIERELR